MIMFDSTEHTARPRLGDRNDFVSLVANTNDSFEEWLMNETIESHRYIAASVPAYSSLGMFHTWYRVCFPGCVFFYSRKKIIC
jgi:hypothetical protein